MAIEIVTPGNAPEAEIYEGHCGRCRSHLKATRAECIRCYFLGLSGFTVYVHCPTVYKKRRWWFNSTCGEAVLMRPPRE